MLLSMKHYLGLCFLFSSFGRSYASQASEQSEVGSEVSQTGDQNEGCESGAPWSGRFSPVSCFRPLRADRVIRPDGTSYVTVLRNGSLELPCAKCVGCRMDRSRSWSIRIGHEAQGWDSNYFVTFDYAPEHLKSWSLVYKDFQLFMKRLRKECRGGGPGPDGRRPIRFFACGEYGGRFQRPHWHAILFNLVLRDREEYHNGTFRSQSLERLWGMGNCVVGDVTPESSAYVAGYTVEKAKRRGVHQANEVVDVESGELVERRDEFVVMSRRPGIGGFWYQKFAGDLFPRDRAVQAGKEFKVPRFYFEKFKLDHPAEVEAIVDARWERAALVDPAEGSPARRAVREAVAEARLQMFSERSH